MQQRFDTSLQQALTRALGGPVSGIHYDETVLQGGTVGDVRRLRGEATAPAGTLPFDLVVKTQKQWERPGDPDSWRREYDIYKNGLMARSSGQLKLPDCYLLEEEPGENRMWTAFIQGRTGSEALHGPELALAAECLGSFQAEFHQKGEFDLPYLRPFPAVRSSFAFWWGRMRELLRQGLEGFPPALSAELFSLGEGAQDLLASLEGLPRTLCQGDVHHDNLILRQNGSETQVFLLDWDCAGYGMMGEDALDMLMEAFVYSDRDPALFPAFRREILDAYARGAASQGVDFRLEAARARTLLILAWGFRVADLYLYYQEAHPKKRCIALLEKMLK